MEIDVKLLTVLRKLNRSLLDTLGKDLSRQGITRSEYEALVHLNEVGKATVQELADVSLITSGTATHLINKLIKSGCVTKEQDQEDKRFFWVEITDQGKDRLKQVNLKHLVFLKELLSDFTDIEKENFIEQIKHFGINISNKNRSQE